jgi:hypothetical protein
MVRFVGEFDRFVGESTRSARKAEQTCLVAEHWHCHWSSDCRGGDAQSCSFARQTSGPRE